jgi:DNA-binding NarL/FixJ family response regulator
MPLTPRELQVLQALAEGRPVKEIAFCLGISPRTVTRHIANARGRVEARSTIHLVVIALNMGAIGVECPKSTIVLNRTKR